MPGDDPAIHPRLRDAVDGLRSAGVPVLGSAGAGESASVDVPPRALRSAAEVLAGHGFVALRRGARRSVGGFVGYDAPSDRWLVLGVGRDAPDGALPGRGPAGVAVALMAPDGAGKSTLAAELRRRCALPSWTGYLGLYPAGERRRPRGLGLAARVGRQWRAYAAGRWHQARGRLVVFDRFPYDALVPPARPGGRLDRLRRAALARCLPAPDLVVVLDAPGAVLAARTDEADADELERRRRAYRALAPKLPCPAVVVDAGRPLDEVRRDVTAQLWQTYLARRGRRAGA